MQNPDPAQSIDRAASTLRWMVLLAMVLAAASRGPLPWPVVLAFTGAALWNGALGILPGMRQLPRRGLLVVAGDVVTASLLFTLSGGPLGPLAWAGGLPLASASLYNGARGALAVTLVDAALLGLISLALATQEAAVLFIIVFLALSLAAVVGVYLTRGNSRQGRADKQTNGDSSQQQTAQRRRSLFDLISALSATLNYQRVLDLALDLSANALAEADGAADRLVSAVLLFSPKENNASALRGVAPRNGDRQAGVSVLRPGPARRFIPADMRLTFSGKSGLIARVIEVGGPRLSKELDKDPELSRVISLHTCKSAYCLPLRTGLDTCGVILFAHPNPDFFTPERREVLDIAANQVTIAIQNARLYQDLELEKERMMEIQEEARQKMARDLHDGPTQSVAAIAMRVNFARRLMERDARAAAEELFKIEELARRTTKEIRHMLFTLRPLVLESQGLVAALKSMSEKMRETYSQNVIIQADPAVIQDLEAGKQGVIFYIIEEAANNARKHAQAAHIWVRLKPLQNELVLLEIEDDGVGFDPNAVNASYENRGSLGMVNMRERTELINGMLRIDSAKGKGTRIRVLIPLTEEAADRLRRGL